MSSQQGNPRRARVAQTIRLHLSEMVHRELKDPRLQAVALISVNQVELNRDMSVAQVFVAFPGTDEKPAREAMRALVAGAKRLRGPLARRMNLARAPQLRFSLDTSDEFAHRLTEIVREDEELRTTSGAESDSTSESGSDSESGSESGSGSGSAPGDRP